MADVTYFESTNSIFLSPRKNPLTCCKMKKALKKEKLTIASPYFWTHSGLLLEKFELI